MATRGQFLQVQYLQIQVRMLYVLLQGKFGEYVKISCSSKVEFGASLSSLANLKSLASANFASTYAYF